MNMLFPEFQRFIESSGLSERKFSGDIDKKLPRILGQGKTNAVGLNLPPAPIERKIDLINLNMPADVVMPENVRTEIESVRDELKQELDRLMSEEGSRRLCSMVLNKIGVAEKGIKNNYFYAERFLLIPDKKRISWSWCITPHYPIIDKIPPDVEYIEKAFHFAKDKSQKMLLSPDEFEDKLGLSFLLAKYFSKSDEILITDVKRMFTIASQEKKFWNSPQRKFFVDSPAALFIVNLLNWKKCSHENSPPKFELIPATLQQAHGPGAKVFFLPIDQEGTQTRPYIYIRKSSA